MTAPRDVAIVGGGAVGLLLACLLAQRGADVVVLERRRDEPAGSRAIGIHAPGLAALAAIGLADAVRREAAPIRHGIALSGGRELARLRFAAASIVSLPQHRTEALLRQRLAALAPAALRTGARVTGLEQRPASVVLALEGGERVEATWAVGADGVRSDVRALLGIEWQRRRGAAPYAMADVPDGPPLASAAALDGPVPESAAALDGPGRPGGRGIAQGSDATAAADAALLHLEPAGIVESFPMPQGRRWVARLDAARGHLTVAELQAILDARLVAPPRLSTDAHVSAFTAQQGLAATLSRGRVTLVGDAAHEVSPIGGQGMSLGWLDALALDRALAAAAGDEGALAAYARSRRRPAERAMRRAAWNMAMGAPARGAAMRARLAVVRVLALPPARRPLLGAFTMRGL